MKKNARQAMITKRELQEEHQGGKRRDAGTQREQKNKASKSKSSNFLFLFVLCVPASLASLRFCTLPPKLESLSLIELSFSTPLVIHFRIIL